MKEYNIGYVPGSFDLFHVGHLNLIKKSKERCNYLIVGVCSDELIEQYKCKKPYISLEERKAIVEAIKYVDQVVTVDFKNTDKIDAWKLYHYDCHFAGDDHVNHWIQERKYLESQGVQMEFFSYTKEISSTMIRERLENNINV